MEIKARNDIVVAVRSTGQTTTATGIVLSSSVTQQYATVVALGEKRSDGKKLVDWDFSVGDQVVVGTNPMNTIIEDGVEYEFYRSASIIAVISK